MRSPSRDLAGNPGAGHPGAVADSRPKATLQRSDDGGTCMNEQGWHGFLQADGVEDWVVLHGGATAVFRTRTFADAARLAALVAENLAFQPAEVVLTIGDGRVAIRLTRDLWQLAPRHIELARAVSSIARAQGAIADRRLAQEVQIAIAAKPDEIDVSFWRAALGYAPAAPDNAADPLGHGSTVWMQELDPERSLRHAMHIDVSVAREHVAARLEAAIAAGGRVVDDSHAPAHWTLADRAGNRLCICAWPDGSTLFR